MSKKDQLYQETLESQCDAALTYIAHRIFEEDESLYDQIEKECSSCEISPHVHEKIDTMIKQLRIESTKRKRRGIVKNMTKVCAIILIALVSTGTLLVGTVDAFKYRFEGLVAKLHPSYFDIKPAEDPPEKTLSKWYPAYLPDGYSLEKVYTKNLVTTLSFKDGNGNSISFEIQPASDANMYMDNEGIETDMIKIRMLYKGYWTENEGITALVWVQEDQLMLLVSSLPIEELKKIAESVQ